LGIDAEELRELPDDMIAYILGPREREILREDLRGVSSPISSEGLSALLAFSAKEAFYKCLFPKIRGRFGFHDVEFRLRRIAVQSAPGAFVIRMCRHDINGAPDELEGRFLHSDGYVVSGISW
jgi:4'-phosphopantetheinyl transferase EntD